MQPAEKSPPGRYNGRMATTRLDIHHYPDASAAHSHELQAQLDEKHVVLHVDDAAKLWLAEKGYDVTMGARPMARLIQDKIKRPLAEQILFGRLSEHGGDVFIQLKDDELTFDYEDEPAEAV